MLVDPKPRKGLRATVDFAGAGAVFPTDGLHASQENL